MSDRLIKFFSKKEEEFKKAGMEIIDINGVGVFGVNLLDPNVNYARLYNSVFKFYNGYLYFKDIQLVDPEKIARDEMRFSNLLIALRTFHKDGWALMPYDINDDTGINLTVYTEFLGGFGYSNVICDAHGRISSDRKFIQLETVNYNKDKWLINTSEGLIIMLNDKIL